MCRTPRSRAWRPADQRSQKNTLLEETHFVEVHPDRTVIFVRGEQRIEVDRVVLDESSSIGMGGIMMSNEYMTQITLKSGDRKFLLEESMYRDAVINLHGTSFGYYSARVVEWQRLFQLRPGRS